MVNGERATILVVDDDPAILKLISSVLEQEGFSIINSFNGKEALKQVEIHQPQLILIDMVMPEMDGVEFIRLLRKSKKSIPLIVMSGNLTGIKFLGSVKLLGAEANLIKPFGILELQQTVEGVLDRQRTILR
jgi:CheY-like chemotaxis protein